MEKYDDAIKSMYRFVEAEEEALKEAGIEIGTAEFNCPLCGGKAKVHRYCSGGRIHGLGSGCESCGMRHT